MERSMSDVLEGAVCGVDGCAPAALDHFGPASGAKTTLAIEVISDAICPWCWVAKRRLDRAIAALAPDVTASVTWRPFELNPEMPKAGVDLTHPLISSLSVEGSKRIGRNGVAF
jgi:hypothetical protein